MSTREGPPAWASYKQHPLDDRWDAIVIGSGIGGLATAALLGRHGGKRVLVLERHYTAGGYTHVFHRPGYEWDVGLHYIGQVHDRRSPVRAAFDHLTDGALEWSPMPDVYDRVVLGGRTYEFARGTERLRAYLHGQFPGERQGIDAYLRAVRSCTRAANFYFVEKALPGPLAAVAGPFLRAPFMRWARQTTGAVLRRFTSNADLAGLLAAQWGDYGLPPRDSSFAVHATVVAHYLDGASYPVGGAGRIVQTIAPLIQRHGGRIVVNADVREVLVEQGRAAGVRMADGRDLRAPVVVSNAGARNTFERLLPADLPELQSLRGIIRLLPGSMAFMTLYIGARGCTQDLGLPGSNLWVHPSADHDGNAARFSRDPEAAFPFVFISFPSAKDPSFASRHPGHSTIEALTAVPYDWFSRWEDSRWKRRSEGYEAFKQAMAARLRAIVEEHVPAVRGRIEHAELSTPLTARHFMNYERGEAYGLAPTPARFRARELRPQTPLPGLYLTGQDVSTLGVTGALFGGALTASVVLRRNLMREVTTPR